MSGVRTRRPSGLHQEGMWAGLQGGFTVIAGRPPGSRGETKPKIGKRAAYQSACRGTPQPHLSSMAAVTLAASPGASSLSKGHPDAHTVLRLKT